MSPCDGVHGGSPCVLAPVPGLRPAPGFSPSSRERYRPRDILLAGPGPRRGTVSLSKESSCEDVIRSHVCCNPSLLLLFRGETLSLRTRQHHRAQRSACPQLAGSGPEPCPRSGSRRESRAPHTARSVTPLELLVLWDSWVTFPGHPGPQSSVNPTKEANA